MALPLLAIPVLHSSGGFIAYGSAGYMASTLSGTWAGAFIAGNTALVASAATGVAGAAAGVWAGLAGAGKSAAVAVGLAPATFLGLTPMGWAIAGGAALTAAGAGALAYYKSETFQRAVDAALPEINEERIKAGLEPFTNAKELLAEVISEYTSKKDEE